MALASMLVASMADGQITVTLTYDDITRLATILTATNSTGQPASGYLNGVAMQVPPGGITLALPLPGHAPVSVDALVGGLQWSAVGRP